MDDLPVPLQEMLAELLQFTPKLFQALVILALGMWVAGLAARGLHRALSQSRTDPELALLVSRVVRIGLAALTCVVALEQVEFDLTGFVAGLGIIGFTIGFALQDVSKNLVAGLLLLLQQPFDIGEAIEVGGYAGVVTGINLRATQLRTFDGVEVLIPNTDVYAKVVKIFGATHFRRLQLAIAAGSAEADRVKEEALAALAAVPGLVRDKPSPRAMVQSVEAAACKVQVYFWIDLRQVMVIRAGDAAVLGVREALQAAALEPRSVSLEAVHADATGGVGIR